MIKSMTGFGRAEVSSESCKVTVEMKSVNHRYLDVNMKMPKKLNFFEASIRNLLKEYIQRGKVDLFISYEDLGIENAADLKVFARYSDISSENGTGTDKVEVKTYFEGSNASHEKDIANYIAINDLI